jgi:hypothetical protein
MYVEKCILIFIFLAVVFYGTEAVFWGKQSEKPYVYAQKL